MENKDRKEAKVGRGARGDSGRCRKRKKIKQGANSNEGQRKGKIAKRKLRVRKNYNYSKKRMDF